MFASVVSATCEAFLAMTISPWVSRWQAIKPYVAFQVNPRKGLSAYEKRKVRAYFKLIRKLQSPSRPVHVYRGKVGSKRLKGAQKYAQHPTGFRQLRVAFIPNPSGESVRLKFAKDGRLISITSKEGITRRVYLFKDYEEYHGEAFDDTETVCKRIFNADKGKSKFWFIANGEYEIKSGEFSAEFVPEQIKALFNQYSRETSATDEAHVAERWLNGIVGYTFFGQLSYEEYKKARGFKLGKKKAKKRKKHKGKEDM